MARRERERHTHTQLSIGTALSHCHPPVPALNCLFLLYALRLLIHAVRGRHGHIHVQRGLPGIGLGLDLVRSVLFAGFVVLVLVLVTAYVVPCLGLCVAALRVQWALHGAFMLCSFRFIRLALVSGFWALGLITSITHALQRRLTRGRGEWRQKKTTVTGLVRRHTHGHLVCGTGSTHASATISTMVLPGEDTELRGETQLAHSYFGVRNPFLRSG